MRRSTGSRPQDLGLRGIQLQPVGTHPPGIINTVGGVLELQWRRRSAEPVDLCVVCVQTWAKTVSPDQQNQVGSVQHEQDRAKNGPLRYTTHDQS